MQIRLNASQPVRHVLIVLALLVAAGSLVSALAQPPQGRGQGGRGQGPGRGGPPGGTPPRDGARDRATATGTSVVSGVVLVAGMGVPARNARVALNGAEGGGSRSIVTDENGAFSFTRLPAGRYTLSASKAGHVGVSYGAARPGRPGTPIVLADGQRFSATLQIARGGVITGTVTDEHGEPTPGTQVRVMRYAMQAGRRTLQSSGSGSTDDRGIYRIFSLQPGDYVVAAHPRNVQQGGSMSLDVWVPAWRAGNARAELAQADQQASGYAPVYYPGTVVAAQATPLTIDAGDERGGIDFQLQRVPMATIEGTVVNATGQATRNLQVTLADTAQNVPGAGVLSARPDAEGRFRISNVQPGSYRLLARAQADAATLPPDGRGGGPPPQLRLWGALDVSVDGRNLSNVIVTLQRALTLSGRIVFESAATQPAADSRRVMAILQPIDQGPGVPAQTSRAQSDAAGRFTIPGVTPGMYRLTASAPGSGNSGWFVESALIDGQDALDFPFEIRPGGAVPSAVITLTDRQARLSGRIVGPGGRPAPEQTLILYPADARFWSGQSRRIRSTRPATDGQFSFQGIPGGDYRLAAMVDVEPGAWFDPAFLQEIDAASTPVRVADGEQKVQNLQVQ